MREWLANASAGSQGRSLGEKHLIPNTIAAQRYEGGSDGDLENPLS